MQAASAYATSSPQVPALTAPKSKRHASQTPNGVLSAKPHRLISALMRRGDSCPVNALPMTA